MNQLPPPPRVKSPSYQQNWTTQSQHHPSYAVALTNRHQSAPHYHCHHRVVKATSTPRPRLLRPQHASEDLPNDHRKALIRHPCRLMSYLLLCHLPSGKFFFILLPKSVLSPGSPKPGRHPRSIVPLSSHNPSLARDHSGLTHLLGEQQVVLYSATWGLIRF